MQATCCLFVLDVIEATYWSHTCFLTWLPLLVFHVVIKLLPGYFADFFVQWKDGLGILIEVGITFQRQESRSKWRRLVQIHYLERQFMGLSRLTCGEAGWFRKHYFALSSEILNIFWKHCFISLFIRGISNLAYGTCITAELSRTNNIFEITYSDRKISLIHQS